MRTMKWYVLLLALCSMAAWTMSGQQVQALGALLVQEEPEDEGAEEQEAGEAEEAEEAQPEESEPEEATPSDRPERRRERDRDRMRDAQRLNDPKFVIERMEKLHEAIFERLELNDDQADEIDELFEQQYKTLEELQNAKPEEETEEVSEEEMRELVEKMRAARESGDDAQVDAIRSQIMERSRTRRQGAMETTRAFLRNVSRRLEGEQVTQFQELVKDAGLELPGPPGGNDVRALMRAAMRPDMGLSDDQRQSIREIIRDAMRDFRGGPMPEDEQAKQFEDVKKQIMEELDADQQKKLEERLVAERDRFAPGGRIERNRGPQGKPEEQPADESGEESESPDDE